MKFAKTFILFICFLSQIFAQQVTLYRVNVEGNTTTSDKMIKYSAGLRDGLRKTKKKRIRYGKTYHKIY